MASPMNTYESGVKFWPVMVRVVPPAVDPVSGVTAFTKSPYLNVADPEVEGTE